MLYIYFLLFALQGSDDKILEQGDTFVPISDMDGYVYLLSPDKRPAFINDTQQMEKNLITMLNINIVNDYITNNGLENHVAFSNVDDVVNEMTVDLDAQFYLKLGLDQSVAYRSVKDFIIKKERFVRMSDLIKNQLLDGEIELYLKEHFIINRSQFVKPEKRDISLIKIDNNVIDTKQVKKILKDLLENDDFDHFSMIADKYSYDKNVKYNHGHLKEFHLKGFSYPFNDEVFEYGETGVVPKIFKFKNDLYIVRVNKIITEVEPKFEDYKEQLISKILPDLVQERVQRIIDSKAKYKVEVNEDVASHVFERYKVLLEN